MKPRNKRPAFAVAFCALTAALGAAAMLASGLIPVLTYCSPMAAGILLIPVLWEFGRKQAWMTWAVTAALSLLLCADKEAAFFYLFLGYYPILRRSLDRVGPKVPRFLLKLGFFALALGLMYGILIFVLHLDAVLNDLGAVSMAVNLALYAALVAVMLVFDRALEGMTRLYGSRLRPRLRILR